MLIFLGKIDIFAMDANSTGFENQTAVLPLLMSYSHRKIGSRQPESKKRNTREGGCAGGRALDF
jgi:hypothetical protein